VHDAIAALDPKAMGESTVALLAPWQQEEIAHGRPEYDAAEIKEDKYGVDTTLGFISGRAAEAEGWLAANKPAEEPPPAGPGGASSSRGVPPAAPQIVPGRLRVVDGILVSRLWVSGPGWVAQRVSLGARHDRIRICAAHALLRQAGPVVLRCKLSAEGRRRLRRKSLRLKVNTTFIPTSGSPVSAGRSLVVPSDRAL
jgi:hypothetical protein